MCFKVTEARTSQLNEIEYVEDLGRAFTWSGVLVRTGVRRDPSQKIRRGLG